MAPWTVFPILEKNERNEWFFSMYEQILARLLANQVHESNSHENHEELERNLSVLDRTKNPKAGTRTRLRRIFAIYRLYKYHNIPIQALAQRASVTESAVRDYIGEAFTWECLSSKECWARGVLMNDYNNP